MRLIDLRYLLHLFVLACAVSSGIAQGQGYPTRPVRLIVPFASGGPTDALARLYGDALAQALGQPFIVESKPGAAGNVGSDYVAKARPDGYTLLLGSLGTHGINANLYEHMPYDTVRDFSPVSLVAQTGHVVVVHPSLGVNTLSELIAYAKANPGKISYASAGVGSTPHLAVELLESTTGIHMVHVPYKGGGQAITDLVTGRVQLMIPAVLLPLQHIRSGSLKALAVTSARRDPALPDTPTTAEAGAPGLQMVAWFGIMGPAGMPNDVIARLHAAIVRVVQSPELRDKLLEVGMTAATDTPAEFSKLIESDLARWHAIVKSAGVKLE